MKRKSSKRKKPPRRGGSWFQSVGTFLAGAAALLKVIFDLVVWLASR